MAKGRSGEKMPEREFGTGTLRWRTGNSYEFRYQGAYRMVHGSTDLQANRAADKLAEDIDRGTAANAGRLTVQQHCEEWLAQRRTGNQVRPQTLARYEGLLRHDVFPKIGGVRLAQLKRKHVRDVVDAMTARGAAPASVTQMFRVLSGALTSAVEDELIAVNPARGLSKRLPRSTRRKPEPPSPQEVGTILKAAEGTQWHSVYVFLSGTGARRGEALALRWSDVDLKTARARINRTAQREPGGTVYFDAPKTPNARRAIALPAFVVAELESWKKLQAEALGVDFAGDRLIFTDLAGTILHPDSTTKAFRRLALSAGVDTHLHDLRHAVATQLFLNGVHPKRVSAALGHASVGFTLDVYSHLIDGDQDATAAALDVVYGS